MKNITDIHILMGLPGSGKSTYAAELSNISKRTVDKSLFIDCDMYMFDPEYSFLKMKSIDAVLRRYLAVTSNFNVICIDGLITTNEQVQTVINLCHLKMNAYSKPDEFRIIIDHWNEDRETCIFNDKFRRERSSETTIRNMQFVQTVISLILRFQLKSFTTQSRERQCMKQSYCLSLLITDPVS